NMMVSIKFSLIHFFNGTVKPLPQDSERSKEDRWGITARKGPIGSTNRQWGMKKTPLTEVSLYAESMQKTGQSSELFKYWKAIEKRSLPSDSSENPLYSDQLKGIKKRKSTLKKTVDLTCTLRQYQLDGAKWLVHLNKHKMGALLTDDMGLEKTIQTF
ncbi:SNF2-related protein, partial [Bacillus rhizoplanae]